MSLQANWRWCNKCQCLAFAGNPSAGCCAAGGTHNYAGSGAYGLTQNDSSAPGQANWRWCNKCQELTFAGNPSAGDCACGGSHDHVGSGDYVLVQNVPSQSGWQANWRWCNKCQALAFAGNPSLGDCPAGGTHDHTGSGDYQIELGSSETSITLNGSPNVSGLNGHVTLTIQESGAYSFSGSWSPSNVFTGVISQDVNFVMTLRDAQGTAWVFSTSGTVPSESTYSFNNNGTNPSLAANWQFLQLAYTAHDQVNAGLDLGATWTAIENWYKQNEQTINEVVQVVGAIAGAVAS